MDGGKVSLKNLGVSGFGEGNFNHEGYEGTQRGTRLFFLRDLCVLCGEKSPIRTVDPKFITYRGRFIVLYNLIEKGKKTKHPDSCDK
jgi:hypothetical protein